MKNYIKYRNGIRVDMMGNYHGGCRKSCCKNTIGFPTEKGISNNCKVTTKSEDYKMWNAFHSGEITI